MLGKTEESALEKVKIAVVDWVDWVNKNGENYPEITDGIEVEVAEMFRVNYNPAEAGKPEPLFWSEVSPVQKEDIERTIRLLKYSRRDLLELVSNLTEDYLDWKPPDKPRTIRNTLAHIAYVEPWYVTRLNIKLPIDYPKDLFKLLNHTREIVINCLQNFPERKMKGVFQPKKIKVRCATYGLPEKF